MTSVQLQEAVTVEVKRKYKGKNRLDLVPPELILSVGKVLSESSDKHGDRNWEKGESNYGDHFASLLRHLYKWWMRVPVDQDTGESHLSHAACRLAFLIVYEERKIGTDDRPDKFTT